ncbi:response regulator [Poseidonibacter sp.]|uniref:response regulator n=1 Tax=Poseidonibacter sp. TaxID=2321188 RepID=UPI003C718075
MQITKEQINNMKVKTKKLNVLIVDDDAEALNQVDIMCKELFKTITLANDGLEAIIKYKDFLDKNDNTFDLVLTDINMPEINGLELSEKIKKINPNQQILIMSAYNDSFLLQKIINSGINTYIHKPIQFDQFFTAIFKLTNIYFSNKEYELTKNKTINLNKELMSRMQGYNSLSLSFSIDNNGIITFVSDKLLEIISYEKEDLLGENIRILIHPDIQEDLLKKLWKIIKIGSIWRGRIQNITKKKRNFWTNTTIGPYFDEFNKIIGYYFILEDITAQVNTNELYDKINLLLNNVNEGFLLFNKDFEINRGYSIKCISIFNQEIIEGQNVSQMLFSDIKKRNLFEKIILEIYESSSDLSIDLLFSLLPKYTYLNDRYIEIRYKFLDNKLFMLILKDATERKKLEKELKRKEQYQKMLISIVSNNNDFIDIKLAFEILLKTLYKDTTNTIFLPTYIIDLKRELHTFKGLFLQINFVYTPNSIHELESKIEDNLLIDNYVFTLNYCENILLNFRKDIQIITHMLGENYILEQEKLYDNSKVLTKIKDDILNIVVDPKHINFKLQDIASKIESMTYLNLYNLLSKYIPVIEDLSVMLNKSINSFVITGDKNLKVPPFFINIYRNLIHLLRNSIDHGIEDENTRLLRNKDPKGNISCDFNYDNGFLFLKISDDGNGINLYELKKKALERNIYNEYEINNISEKELLFLIFEDGFSTKESATNISGRGIGNSSFKQELEMINGKIEIINKEEEGLSYILKIPMENISNTNILNNALEDCIDVADIVIEKTKNFLVNDLNLDIIDSRYCNNTNFENKINTFINFTSNQNFIFCFSCSTLILKTFFSLLPSLDENFEEYKEDLAKEFINTIIGLAIQDLPSISKTGTLDVPYLLNSVETYDKHYNKNYKIIQNIIQTNIGNINCSLLVESK